MIITYLLLVIVFLTFVGLANQYIEAQKAHTKDINAALDKINKTLKKNGKGA